MDEEIIKRLEEIEARVRVLEGTRTEVNEESRSDSNIFCVEGTQLTVTQILGGKVDDKTKNTALLTLLGYKEKLGVDKILSSEVKRNVAINKIPIENFATYLGELIPQSILRIGKPQSKKSAYRLTSFGEAKAKSLLKEIISNDK